MVVHRRGLVHRGVDVDEAAIIVGRLPEIHRDMMEEPAVVHLALDSREDPRVGCDITALRYRMHKICFIARFKSMPNVESLAEAPQSQGRSGAPLTVLFVTVFVDLLGFGIVIPFLPMYAERLEVGAAGIGLILAIYSMMQFLCAPILGRISDHVVRRPVIMLGLLGSSISYFIYGFADSFVWLLLSRACLGACAATVSTAQAYVADTTIESKRAHGMGMIGAAFGLGFAMGPARGGLSGHSTLRTPVFFPIPLTFANLIFAAMRLPESHRADH